MVLLLLSRRMKTSSVALPLWGRKNKRSDDSITGDLLSRLEGVYRIIKDKKEFGELAALSSSYTIEGGKKRYYITFFLEGNGLYIICEARRVRYKIVMEGYWVDPVLNETGVATFSIRRFNGAGKLLNEKDKAHPLTIIIKGRLVTGKGRKTKKLIVRFRKKLPVNREFYTIAHRGGGRNIDYLPHSENSLEMLRLASRLGASSVEIDVRLTEDKVPVLFHDAVLSAVTIQDYFLLEPLDQLSLEETRMLRLKKGEMMPTLEEALDVLLNETPIKVVWLDIKYIGNLQPVRDLQMQYLNKAATLNREFMIYIGVPEPAILNNLAALEDFTQIPSLLELEPEDVLSVNADVWAPKWTGGFRNNEAAQLKEAGKKLFVWTVNDPEAIKNYIDKTIYNGVASDVPFTVAFYYFTHEVRMNKKQPFIRLGKRS